MNKPKFETPDMVEKNIEKLAEIFPNCITEARDKTGKLKKAVNFEMLQQILSTEFPPEGSQERYEFTWVGKKEAIIGTNIPIRKTLRPYLEKSKNWQSTRNIYIEGDNLDALKLLQESYLHAVDVIYIDPPYNTGSNLIYKNNFFKSEEDYLILGGSFDLEGNKLFVNTETNGRFHSDWCSMIYSRLILARKFLKNTGVLVCAIDQSEINTLGLMLQEIFSDKEITLVTVVHNPSGIQGLNFSYSNEYLYFVYDGSKRSIAMEERDIDSADIRSFMNGAKGNTENYLRSSGYKSFYPIFVKDNFIIGFGEPVEKDIHPIDSNIIKENGVVEVYPIDSDGIERKWLFTRDTVENIKDDLKVKVNKNNKIEIIRVKNNINYKTVWTHKKYNAKQYGTTLLNKLIDSPFTFPKSLYAVEDSLKAALNNKNDALIMDFFSGSATTAHAVLELNAKDGGKRQFIMIQLPEILKNNTKFNSICDIGEERIRLAGEKIKADNPLTTQDLDIGFRVFKVDSSNMNDVYYSAGEYNQDMLADLEDNIKPDRTDLDLLFGCLLDWGLPISLPYTSEQIENCTVHTYNEGDLVACFDENIPENVIKEIAKRKPMRAVFRDAGFGSSPEKINVTEIFKMLAPDTDVKVI